MGFVKEPKGFDFVIQSKPLTDKGREEISKFIADYKAKRRRRCVSKTKSSKPA